MPVGANTDESTWVRGSAVKFAPLSKSKVEKSLTIQKAERALEQSPSTRRSLPDFLQPNL